MPSFAKSVPSGPLITVIVAVYNNARPLQQCIDSIATQGYLNKELIVIDGGSTDGSVEILLNNQARISFWTSEPDHGIYDAWNKGLAHANGEWICFLGADDYFWNAQVMERVAAELVELPRDIRVAYGQIMLIGTNNESLYPVGEPWPLVKSRFRQIMSIPHPGMMHRHELFRQIGNFDVSYRIAGDYELLLRELKQADAHFMPGIILVGMRRGGISDNPVNTWVGILEVRRAQWRNNLLMPGGVWLMAAVRAYLKLLLFRLVGRRLATRLLAYADKS